MAENSRIEDLRKRYHENPRRFFAPLANEYRKAGFLDRALLLCQKHVPEQPENMNGLVVFGQTLFESGNTAEAQEPFERALKLDPENLIALRHLGDIARLGGDVPTAKQWYERVLELDRRNDEVLDLLQEMGVADVAPDAPAARPSSTAGGLVSVASSVSVSGGPDLGMIDLSEPAAPPAKPAAPVKTLVINAQALADRDRREAEGAPITQPVPAVTARPASPAATPAASSAATAEVAAKPAKRASLLDIDFDFSETGEPAAKPVVPAAPVMSAEAAEYGFADMSGAETLAIEPPPSAANSLAIEPPMTADAPLAFEPTSASDSLMVETTGDMAPLGLEPTSAAPTPAPAPELPASDFELAEFSSDVSPLAGLEATEFTSEAVAPLAELENESASASMSTVPPLSGLDRPDVEPGSVEPLSGIADLPLLDAPEAPAEPTVDLPLLEAPIEEPASAKPKPRMTKADLSSLPLLADFGLEDDEPASSKPTPILTPAVVPPAAKAVEPPSAVPAIAESSSAPRPSKATPTFVTETMAALYVKQGHIGEAVGVYRQLVAQSPNDSGLRAKLAELERMQQAELAPAAAAPDVDMPDFDEPLDSAMPEPAAANAALSGVSFGGIGLQGQGSDAPMATPGAAAGPSARDFFAGFARRAVAAAAVVAATVAGDAEAQTEPETSIPSATSQWPLDALFGAAQDVRDLHAAEVMAGVGSFEGPDGGTGLASLFARVSEPAKRAVPRASEMLKFDQFFQAPGTAAPPAPAATNADAPLDGDDDLDQFHGWLKGLKK